jgi:hypothetical protein
MNSGDALDEAKRRISEKYLGVGCIHGVGLSRADNAVRVYVSTTDAIDDASLEEMRRVADPFEILIVEDAPPRFAG